MTTTAHEPGKSGTGRGGAGGWRRIMAAQESGLILVIILLAAALTIFGGSKPDRRMADLPAGAQVTQAESGVMTVAVDSPALADRLDNDLDVSADGNLKVTWPGGERVFIAEGRLRVLDSDPAAQRLMYEVQVNRFLDVNNLVLLAKDASFIAIMAVAMTAIIALGGIDLSVGSMYALAAILGAMVMSSLPPEASTLMSVTVGVLVCCAVGAACGFANGAMIVGLRVHPFIITLGTMAILRGLVFLSTKGQSVGDFPTSFTTDGFKAEFFGVYPVPVLVMVLVAVVGALVLSRTVLGRRVYAIGGNETAARYAGVPVGRVKIIAFTVMGAMAGLSACVYLGYFGAAEPGAGNGYELRVIAAAVIGGASLSGGRGSALGAMLGAIVIEMINNAMLILEIDQNYTQVVMGAAIVLAVLIDQAKGRLGAKKR